MAEIIGLDQFLRKLKDLPDGIDTKRGGPLERAMRKGASVWAKAARQKLAAVGPGIKNERTGDIRLKDSIVIRKDPDPRANNADVRFEVGYRRAAFWGAFVEKGTSKQTARPFLRPAFDENEDAILASIRDDLTKSIEEAVERSR